MSTFSYGYKTDGIYSVADSQAQRALPVVSPQEVRESDGCFVLMQLSDTTPPLVGEKRSDVAA